MCRVFGGDWHLKPSSNSGSGPGQAAELALPGVSVRDEYEMAVVQSQAFSKDGPN